MMHNVLQTDSEEWQTVMMHNVLQTDSEEWQTVMMHRQCPIQIDSYRKRKYNQQRTEHNTCNEHQTRQAITSTFRTLQQQHGLGDYKPDVSVHIADSTVRHSFKLSCRLFIRRVSVVTRNETSSRWRTWNARTRSYFITSHASSGALYRYTWLRCLHVPCVVICSEGRKTWAHGMTRDGRRVIEINNRAGRNGMNVRRTAMCGWLQLEKRFVSLDRNSVSS
jgi:hypothetical protein